MKKITRITTQKKNTHRYNIFITDGPGEKYGFSVDEDILIEFNLRKDLELTESLINKLLNQDTLVKSYSKVINYLGYRMRTEKEIRDYLYKDEVDEEHISKIIEKLYERKLIDDQEFAMMFARSRIQSTSKGPTMVNQELMAKGISKDYASKAVQLYTYGVQYEKATKLVEKRLNRSSKDSFTKQLQNVRTLLMRNGFNSEVIQDALADVNDTKDSDEEWEAINSQGEKLLRRHSRKLTDNALRQKVKQGLYQKGFAIKLIDTFLDKAMTEE